MILSPAALSDLLEIEDFLSDDSSEAARRTVDILLERIRVLERFPEAGRLRPDVAIDLRSWPVQGYIVFHRVRAENVEIARILHGSRDVQTEFLP